MKVVFSGLAKRELDDATNFYEIEFEGPRKTISRRRQEGRAQNFRIPESVVGRAW